MPKTQAIFDENPITASVNLSTGEAPTPYLVQDGEAVLIFGTVDASLLQSKIGDETIHPVCKSSGRAAAGFILANFHEASMGPHCELQFFTLASQKQGDTIDRSPFALPIAMGTRPDWGTLCMRLWNDDKSVLAYNNEYLGLNAAPAEFELFERDSSGQVRFDIVDQNRRPIINGHFQPSRATSIMAMWQMLKLVGPRRFLALGVAPYVQGNVINRISAVMPSNRMAQIFTAARHNVTRQWSDTSDDLQISDPEISALDFHPESLQHLWPFHFVYRHPDDRTDNS